MLFPLPERYRFPLLGRCSDTISLRNASASGDLDRHGIHDVLPLDPDEVYRRLVDADPSAAINFLAPPHQLLWLGAIEGGYATHQGGYVTRDGLLVEEFSQYQDKPIREHRHLHKLRPLRHIKRIRGPVVSLAGGNPYNYHHWFVDLLPKLHLLCAHGQIPPGAPVYIEAHHPFQIETLRHLGLDRAGVINSREHQVIHPDTLISASLRYPSDIQEPWILAWLRQTFLPLAAPHPQQPKCLLVSRNRAKSRRLVQENEILDLLAPFNPFVAHLEDFTVAQQLGLFAGADLIVAPHGAGLTNVLAAKKSAHVIELFGPRTQFRCYEYMSRAYVRRYTRIMGEDVTNPSDHQTDIRIDLAELKKALHENLA